MLGYYLNLALRSLRRNAILTTLVIVAIGIGIGASMTMLTIFLNVSGDPIPDRSAQLFVPQIDNWGPAANQGSATSSDRLPNQLSYIDAQALMRVHAARRQTAMYMTVLAITPSNPRQVPFRVPARATYADFFTMFEVPFQYGAPWGAADDTGRGPDVVITQALNDRLFGGADSVGNSLTLGTDTYRVVGVIRPWDPIPRFYDLAGSQNGGEAQIYLPFTTAVGRHLATDGNADCGPSQSGSGEDAMLRSECIWIQFWVELPTAAAARSYRAFLHNYAAEQQRSGRFNWAPRTSLRDVRQWLSYNKVVPTELRILMAASFSFLFACLLNAMGLMLAKFMAHAGSVGVRRALGANRAAIFSQCLVEAGVIGLAGGLLGLTLTVLGLIGTQSLLPGESTRLGGLDVAIAVILAVGATLLAGLYPTWRTSQVQPAWQLKAQ